jgi:hypothetical protein
VHLRRLQNVSKAFATNTEVIVMDEGIQMMPIEKTISEPHYP